MQGHGSRGWEQQFPALAQPHFQELGQSVGCCSFALTLVSMFLMGTLNYLVSLDSFRAVRFDLLSDFVVYVSLARVFNFSFV